MLSLPRSLRVTAVLFWLAAAGACRQDVPLPDVTSFDAAQTGDVRAPDTRRPEPDAAAAPDVEPAPDAATPDRPLHCQSAMFQVQHAKVIVAFDRSTSMNDKPMAPATATRTQFAQQALRSIIQKYGRSVYFGYVEYPLVCRAGGCCSSVVIPPGPHSIDNIDAWWRCRNMPPSCNDTNADSPLGSALAQARMFYDRDDYVIASRSVFVLTDGDPVCTTSTVVNECELAKREVVRMAGWTDKVDTTVFGLGEAQRTSACLNDLAASGGSFMTRVVPDGAQLEKALDEELRPLSREACTLRLREPPGPDEVVRLYLDREPVRRDETHVDGWDFEQGAPSNITVYGRWCDKMSTSGVQRYGVEICFM